jgi:hypothetical protein
MLWSMRLLRVTRQDALRGAIAGARAVGLRGAAQALFEAGGRKVLPPAAQQALRSAVERQAARLVAGVGLLESTASTAARVLEEGAARATAQSAATQTVRAAGRQLLRGMTAAAGAGALIDGGWALLQAVRGVRRGEMTRREAAAHVAREAGTGAAATAAGTAAAALVVTLTGGVAAPAVFVVGAAASLGAKMGLDAWLASPRAPGEPSVAPPKALAVGGS